MIVFHNQSPVLAADGYTCIYHKKSICFFVDNWNLTKQGKNSYCISMNRSHLKKIVLTRDSLLKMAFTHFIGTKILLKIVKVERNSHRRVGVQYASAYSFEETGVILCIYVQ